MSWPVADWPFFVGGDGRVGIFGYPDAPQLRSSGFGLGVIGQDVGDGLVVA